MVKKIKIHIAKKTHCGECQSKNFTKKKLFHMILLSHRRDDKLNRF